MGKKYDRYVEANRQENLAKLNVHITNGGSTREASQAARDRAWNASIDTQEAWDEVIKDPEG